MRKTIPVQSLRTSYATLTQMTPETSGYTKEFISGILWGAGQQLADALHASGQYQGFGYVTPKGEGISILHPEFEEYRRRYY